MTQDDWDALVGQTAANTVALNALMAAFLHKEPEMKDQLLATFEFAGLAVGSKVTPPQLENFRFQLNAWRRAIETA